MIAPPYRLQVDLLLRILPYVANEQTLALKGGTAINLFVRDMPRLSVDIDLTYLPFEERTSALRDISETLGRIKQRLEATILGIRVSTLQGPDGQDTRMICDLPQAQVKLEVNTTLRGHLRPARTMQLSRSVQDEFGKFAAAQVVSQGELFGGKLCAALDRQHPRDLFDVQQLFIHEGITASIRQGFIAGLVSHPRPIHEILKPNFSDQRHIFKTQFAGMALQPFTYEDFQATRERLAQEINMQLTDEDRNFLISFKQGEPDWNLFPEKALQHMPAIQWKLYNIRKLKKQNSDKHIQQLETLEEVLHKG